MFKLPKHPVLNFEIWSFEFVSNFACLRDLPTPAEAGASRRREPLRRRQGFRASDLSLIPLTSSELRVCDITDSISQHIE